MPNQMRGDQTKYGSAMVKMPHSSWLLFEGGRRRKVTKGYDLIRFLTGKSAGVLLRLPSKKVAEFWATSH
jgi:hypothetical protein